MEPEGSSPHSQAHATCPYPELAPPSPHTHILLPRYYQYLFTKSMEKIPSSETNRYSVSQ